MLKKTDEEAKPKEETTPMQSEQDLKAIAELGPSPTIEQLLALHRDFG